MKENITKQMAGAYDDVKPLPPSYFDEPEPEYPNIVLTNYSYRLDELAMKLVVLCSGNGTN